MRGSLHLILTEKEEQGLLVKHRGPAISSMGMGALNYLTIKCRIWPGFPGGASGKESACQCRRCKGHRFDSWVRKIP